MVGIEAIAAIEANILEDGNQGEIGISLFSTKN